MQQFHQELDMHDGSDDTIIVNCFRYPTNCQASDFTAWINLNDQRLQHGIFKRAVNDPNTERIQPMNARAASSEQLARPLFPARHQRAQFLIQNEHRQNAPFLKTPETVRHGKTPHGAMRLRA
jgi:hypothetical protein